MIFFLEKQLAHPTENTWKDLQCVRYNYSATTGESHPFKVLSLVYAKSFGITQLSVGAYCGNY